jgi:hypothetical protein
MGELSKRLARCSSALGLTSVPWLRWAIAERLHSLTRDPDGAGWELHAGQFSLPYEISHSSIGIAEEGRSRLNGPKGFVRLILAFSIHTITSFTINYPFGSETLCIGGDWTARKGPPALVETTFSPFLHLARRDAHLGSR